MSEFNRYYTKLERERAQRIAEDRADFLKFVIFISLCGGLMWYFGIGF